MQQRMKEDEEASITRCFSRSEGPGLLRGTFDNAITNAAVRFLMLSDTLPDNVLIAFTGFVPQKNVIYQEAETDESWYYDEEKINCCSVCLPVEGEMHSNAGVLAWEASFRKYTEILGEMLHIS